MEGRGIVGAELQGVGRDHYLSALAPYHVEFAHVGVFLQLVDDIEGDPAKLVAVVAHTP